MFDSVLAGVNKSVTVPHFLQGLTRVGLHEMLQDVLLCSAILSSVVRLGVV